MIAATRVRRTARVAALVAIMGWAALPALSQTIDFDDLPSGSVIPALPPVQFSHSQPGIDLVAASGQPTVSSPNALGATDGFPSSNPQNLLLPGESVDLALDGPATSISLVVLSTRGAPPGAFELFTTQGTATSGATPDFIVGQDEAYFLSVSSPIAFQSASLRSFPNAGLFAFHVDDVVVPEPQATPSLLCGIAALVAARRTRRVGRASPRHSFAAAQNGHE